MKRLKCVDADDMNYNQDVNYCLSEIEWQLLLNLYEKNQSKMSPLMRNSLSKLICALAASKTITTAQQANLIVALLLLGDDTLEIDESDFSPSHKRKAIRKKLEPEKIPMETNEITELLRILMIQSKSKGYIPTAFRGAIHDRR